MTTATTTTTQSLTVDGVGLVDVSFTERGTGRPFLILHGGPGPQSGHGFAHLLAGTAHVRVVTPTHPGFRGAPRPQGRGSIRRPGRDFVSLLDHLDLNVVTG